MPTLIINKNYFCTPKQLSTKGQTYRPSTKKSPNTKTSTMDEMSNDSLKTPPRRCRTGALQVGTSLPKRPPTNYMPRANKKTWSKLIKLAWEEAWLASGASYSKIQWTENLEGQTTRLLKKEKPSTGMKKPTSEQMIGRPKGPDDPSFQERETRYQNDRQFTNFSMVSIAIIDLFCCNHSYRFH